MLNCLIKVIGLYVWKQYFAISLCHCKTEFQHLLSQNTVDMKTVVTLIITTGYLKCCLLFPDRKGLVHDATTAIWCSNRGMSEAEIIEILQVSK